MKGHTALGRFNIRIRLPVTAAATMNGNDETSTVVKSTENKSKCFEVVLNSMTTLIPISQLVPYVCLVRVISVTYVD